MTSKNHIPESVIADLKKLTQILFNHYKKAAK